MRKERGGKATLSFGSSADREMIHQKREIARAEGEVAAAEGSQRIEEAFELKLQLMGLKGKQ